MSEEIILCKEDKKEEKKEAVGDDAMAIDNLCWRGSCARKRRKKARLDLGTKGWVGVPVRPNHSPTTPPAVHPIAVVACRR